MRKRSTSVPLRGQSLRLSFPKRVIDLSRFDTSVNIKGMELMMAKSDMRLIIGSAASSKITPSVLTYFSCNNNPTPSTPEGWAWQATRLDRAHGENAMGHLDVDPGFYVIAYTLLETTTCPSSSDSADNHEDVALRAWCVANGNVDAEDAYLHYNNDTSVTVSGVTINTKGWPGGTAANRRASRVQSYGWSNYRHTWNWGHATARGYLASRYVSALSTVRGFFVDEAGGALALGGWPIPTPNSGGQIREFSDKTATQIYSENLVTTPLYGLADAITTAIHAADANATWTFNIADFAGDNFRDYAFHCDGALTEFYMGKEGGSYSIGEKTYWDRAAEYVAQNKLFIMAQYEALEPGNASWTAGHYPTKQQRHGMLGVCSYYMCKSDPYIYYSQAQRGDRLLQTYWSAAQERDIGSPTGAYYLWKDSTVVGNDSLGQAFKVYRRDYSSGAIVLFRTSIDYVNTNFAGVAGPFSLGGSYNMLYEDNTLGPTITQVSINYSEGIILIPA